MKRLVPISVFVLAALLVGITPLAASAQAGPTTIYVVQPGDTAYSIASRHCMSVQELTNLNGAVISNPNQLYPGMQLRVVNQCGGGGGCSGPNCGGCTGWNCVGCGSGACDRGPSLHARGWINGNVYTVVSGDTSWSIAQRFSISVNALCQANGINPWFIWAGQRLVIPSCGWSNCPPQPPVQPCTPSYPGNCPPIYYPTVTVPTVIPITPVPTAMQASLEIQSPASNTAGTPLPSTFTVTGRAQNLPAGTPITVQAIIVVPGNTNNTILVLAEQRPALQATGTPGQTTFQASLSVQLSAVTQGFILAYPTSAGQPSASVLVWFSGGTPGGISYNNFSGSQCVVVPTAGAPYFATVGAPQPSGYFPGAVTAQATVVGTAANQGAKLNNQYWFQLSNVPGTTGMIWAPQSSVQVVSSVCTGW
jgi:LysM repeat protein